ncbi:DNA repair protein RAD51 homolog 2-like isoform X1 [Actinia tenebrosa]|uniref:DNA repair protein RAD51 homolog 2 n=1 Tax=Actinia tenebrosa TaxID=6105 RepID=A0A6P8I9W8_ACTTE|nr:DNA repair protein RAD51 homolog 2-like isoform X1 [Actinia tenebrosa]XP_031564833.1 DNA repair protein RAD51 homolog 2-like isoform X1 [Actinia tenebrosa]XP_031564834.1 DNA repair protein RAD51 homolog 2-like isoform X1 [Actinia tenebrosa]XP_031564835.1 DNA repair protein RAD51 homolog 2-like isoform X1 [Actinia tenebrosa]
MTSRRIQRVSGIRSEFITRLTKNRVLTCKDLLSKNPLELLKFTGASYREVQEIQRAASKAVVPKVSTALELRQNSSSQAAFFPTSLLPLDKQLHGGLPCGTISEITGPAGCGKTQFCIMLSILATLPVDKGGLESNVIYIDTEAAFSATRLVEMAESRFPELFDSQSSVLALTEKIHVFWEPTCSALWERLQTLEEEVIAKKVKLIVLDSIASVVRKEFDSRSSKNITERTNLLSKEAAILKYIAETFNIPVVVTNQITTRYNEVDPYSDKILQEVADLDGGDIETDDDGSSHVMAALGNTWSHAVNTRLIVQYLDDLYRQIIVSKSPIAPFGIFTYTIQTKGVVLVEPAKAAKLHSDKDRLQSSGNPSLQPIQVRSSFTWSD